MAKRVSQKVVETTDTFQRLRAILAQRTKSDLVALTDEIEKCLMVVVNALTECDLPADEKLAWCAAMTKRDGVGFIRDEEVKSLQTRIKATRP